MREVGRLLAANGGVVSTAQLLEVGLTKNDIRRLEWDKPRTGWHSCPTADPKVKQAVKSGGVLACVSVVRRSGIWVPDHDLHVRYVTRSARVKGRNCQPFGTRPVGRTAIDSLEVAFSSAVSCLDPEGVVVVLDSALNKGLIEMADATTFVRGSKYAHLRLDEKCDARSESGLETMTRLRLKSRKIGVKLQVEILDIGRVDLLVGKRLVIECDGEETHRGKFAADRERDRRLKALGFEVVRLTYDHVVYDWKAVEQDLLAIIRRGDHLRPAQIDA